jgi:hypothetical protein
MGEKQHSSEFNRQPERAKGCREPGVDRSLAASGGQLAGNLTMQRLLRDGDIRARLEAGHSADPLERGADAAAERCGRSIPCGLSAVSCGGCRHHLVHRKAANDSPRSEPAMFVQAKVSVSQPGDPLEREADRMAEQAVSGKAAPSCAGMTCPNGGCSSCHHSPTLQRKSKPGSSIPAASSPLEGALRSGGHPLDPPVRASMEESLGADFSAVRVHTSRAAAESAQSIQALAYTAGSNVVFGAGQYAPETDKGRKLLAHELAHVVQQPQGVLSRELARDYSTIRSDLTYSAVDWAITEADCDEVLRILTSLIPTDLEDTVHRMSSEGLVSRLLENTSATSRTANATLIGRIQAIGSGSGTAGVTPEATPPESIPAEAQSAPTSFDPCLVDVYALTNAGLLSYYQRALAVVNQGRDAAGYFDNRNLQRRLITERERRVAMGHIWLATMPDAIPQTLYRMAQGPSGELEVTEVPGATVAGPPENIHGSPLRTSGQFDSLLAEHNIERIGPNEFVQRVAPPTSSASMAGITSGFSTFPFGMGGVRSPLFGLPARTGFTLPETRTPVPGAVFEEGVGILDYFAQPFELGYGQTITRRLAAGGTVPIDYPITFDIDEPLPVGDRNASRARQVGRALDPQNRQLLDWLTNRRTKGLGIDFRDIERGRNPLPEISLADDPSSLLTRRFGEITEMRLIFDQARTAIPDISALTPTQLKDQINRNIRDIIQNGRSPEGIAARNALRSSGFEVVPGRGFAAVRPSALRVAGVEGLRGSAGGGLIAVVTSGGIMILDTAEHPEWARELAVSGSLGTSSSFLAGSSESLIYQGGMRMIDTSLAETGVTSLTPGLVRGASRLGGGAVGAMFVEGISMGALEEREHFAPEVTTRMVRSGLLGAGSVWAGAGIGAAAGSVVPVAGTAVGFIVGLIAGGILYAVGNSVVPGGREDWDAYEAGCHFRPVSASAGGHEPTFHYCFTGETPIRMADGASRRIDQLRAGDSVLSYDERDASLHSEKVLKIERLVAPSHLKLRLAKNGTEIGVTGEHPIHTEGLWLPAKMLCTGSIVTWLDNKTDEVSETEIAEVTSVTEPAGVFDLSVSETHTYFAGGILAHNKNI